MYLHPVFNAFPPPCLQQWLFHFSVVVNYYFPSHNVFGPSPSLSSLDTGFCIQGPYSTKARLFLLLLLFRLFFFSPRLSFDGAIFPSRTGAVDFFHVRPSLSSEIYIFCKFQAFFWAFWLISSCFFLFHGRHPPSSFPYHRASSPSNVWICKIHFFVASPREKSLSLLLPVLLVPSHMFFFAVSYVGIPMCKPSVRNVLPVDLFLLRRQTSPPVLSKTSHRVAHKDVSLFPAKSFPSNPTEVSLRVIPSL